MERACTHFAMGDNRETIRGFIVEADLKAKSKDAADDSDDDELDEDEFMEMADIKAAVNGAFPSQSINMPEKKVKFFNEMTKRPVIVKGVFLFPEYWWYIEAEIYKRSKRLVHMPRYRIKNLWDQRCLTAYLKACHIGDEVCVKANKMMASVYKKTEFTVEQVLDLPNFRCKFEGMPLFDEEEAVLSSLEQNLPTADPTMLIERALSCPNLFWSLQTILPKKAYSVLSHNIGPPGKKSKKGTSQFKGHSPRFEQLDAAITESPWELGFSSILFRKYNLCGCEAKLQDLEKSGILMELDGVMRDNLSVYNKLKAHCLRYGHTFRYCPTNTPSLLFHKCQNRARTQQFLCSDHTGAARCEPRMFNHRKIPALYLRRYWSAEKSIAEQLRKIIKRKTGHDDFKLPELDEAEWEELDSSQQESVTCIRTQPVTILSGMGGCGKTTVVSKMVTGYCQSSSEEADQQETKNDQEYAEEDPEESTKEEEGSASKKDPSHGHILLTAPTGKAASLLGRKCGMDSFTIHRVIYSHMSWKKGSDFPWAFAKTKMLVVDECSMVAVTTIERLLDILLRDSSLSKVVLVGDIRQLPSIEPGNFFEDVFQVAKVHGLGVDLKTNHRVDSGGRSIVENARRISLQELPKFDEETLGLPKMPTSRFQFLVVEGVSAKAQDDVLDRLQELLKSNKECIKDPSSSQIITFTRKLVANANNYCCQHYNQHYTSCNNKREFRPNDKICCRKNCEVGNPLHVPSSKAEGNPRDKNTMSEGTSSEERNEAPNSGMVGNAESEEGERSTHRICNGDTYIIKEMKTVVGSNGRATEHALLDDMEGEQIWVDFKSFRRVGKVEHAWCRTIHTFQGSEVKSVVYLLSGSTLESWRHVYTAVTRGQQEVVVIGSREHLRRALATAYERDTGLHGFLQRALDAPDDEAMGASDDDVSAASCEGQAALRDGVLMASNNGALVAPREEAPLVPVDKEYYEDGHVVSPSLAATDDQALVVLHDEPLIALDEALAKEDEQNASPTVAATDDRALQILDDDMLMTLDEALSKEEADAKRGEIMNGGLDPLGETLPMGMADKSHVEPETAAIFQRSPLARGWSAGSPSSKATVLHSDGLTPDTDGNMEEDLGSWEDSCPQWTRSVDRVSPPNEECPKLCRTYDNGDSRIPKIDFDDILHAAREPSFSSGAMSSAQADAFPDEVPSMSSPMCNDTISSLQATTPRVVSQFKLRDPENSPSSVWKSYRNSESVSPETPVGTPKKKLSQFKPRTPSTENGASKRIVIPQTDPQKRTPGGYISPQFKKRNTKSPDHPETNNRSRQAAGVHHEASSSLSPESEELKELSLSPHDGKSSSRKRLMFQPHHSSTKSPKKE